MKPLTDPGKGKPEKEAKAERIKAWKAPAVGDIDPRDAKGTKKLTKATAKTLRDAMRADRRQAWESRR